MLGRPSCSVSLSMMTQKRILSSPQSWDIESRRMSTTTISWPFISLKSFWSTSNYSEWRLICIVRINNHLIMITIFPFQLCQILKPWFLFKSLQITCRCQPQFSIGRGHYWINVRYSGSEDWLLSNDQAFIRDSNKKNVLDPLHPYALSYTQF